MTEATKKRGRKCLRLSPFDFEGVHRARVKHTAAGALSRLLTTGMDGSLLQNDVLVLMITKAEPKVEKTITDTKHLAQPPQKWMCEQRRAGPVNVLQVLDKTYIKKMFLREAS